MHNATERRTIHAQGGMPGDALSASGEIIPGYELEERIGAGGYGEVWRVRAPGGLLKAVKIVYGTMSDRHAVVELKSLERIKGVRHPFILTLERIEIVEGRLLVVTELAEGSLRDLFEEITAKGSAGSSEVGGRRSEVGPAIDDSSFPTSDLRPPTSDSSSRSAGIERNRLLRYMHDVADALDYMFEQHSLQHLDIKPENLLLIGGHVKVADFGLTKDLRDASLSAVAGMTPLYAAPEVFEGRPGRHSDQYSLACVYQYLLTGQPPFRGRTSAQLISQHLHSSPDLTLLSRSDHSAVLRALSKDARKRFESCTAFVNALESAGRAEDAPQAAETPGVSKAPGVRDSKQPRKSPAGDSEQQQSLLYETDVDSETDIETRSPRILRPVSLNNVTSTPRPAVVVGLGGVAGRLLKALKARLAAAETPGVSAPIRLLYIDTDEADIYEAMYGKGGECLTHGDILTAPLKRSSEYRKKFKRLLEWIARRWLFNIPRSRKTEGIRALGRLAFVDHYREISLAFRKSLERVVADAASVGSEAGSFRHADDADAADRGSFATMPIGDATCRESRAESPEPESVCDAESVALVSGLSSLDSNRLPRVFVIAGVGGGTGGGMVLDAGYAMRRALAELKLDEAGITGVFLQHEAAAANNAALPVANGLAFLRELAHFNGTGCYSGDRDAGIPDASHLSPFDRSYFVQLRADGSDRPGNTLDEAAEYVFRSVTGRCAGVFDFLRGPGAESQGRQRLNSFVAKVIGGETAAAAPVGLWTDLTLDVHKRLLKTRGATRLLVAIAGVSDEHVAALDGAAATHPSMVAAIQAQCGDFATVVRDDAERRTFICDEIEGIPYSDIVALLKNSSSESADIAEMLTTRIDVDWEA